MFGYIYITTNNINGKQYIGQKKSEKFLENKYLGSGKILKLAIKKYGKDNFSVQLLCKCDSKEELNNKEEYYIQKYNAQTDSNFYNIRKGGERGPGGPMFKGHHHSEITKKNMSINRKGEKNGNYGNRWHQSDELKKRHSEISSGKGNGMYGKKHSDKTKQLIGMKNKQSMTGRIGISKDSIKKFIKPCDLENYLSDGWLIGFKH